MSTTMSTIPSILSTKYPAKAHCEAVANYIRRLRPDVTDGLIYLESGKSTLFEDCDQEATFRQRRPFFYLSGCALPDSYLTYNLPAKSLTLYIPAINPSSVLWSGLPLSPEDAKREFDVDDVRTTDQLSSSLSSSFSKTIFVIPTQLSHHPFPSAPIDTTILHTAISECRALKDPYEVALIKHANAITASAHHACMRAIKSAKNEREILAVFTSTCISAGAPSQAYTGIFAGGRNAATLHYVHNNASLEGKQNLLLDAGAEVRAYASDVTRTFPISGKFSKESREIYDIVLNMQKTCLAACAPGKNWDDIHILAHKVAIGGLLDLGILKDGSVDEILETRTSCAFFPHGLGHYLGMDTHDTGGNPDYGDSDKMFCYLRKRGPLPVGAVITVEPGIYFCEFIIRPYLSDPKHARFIDEDVLERYWDVGGVRIEDNILITEDGYENLTTAVKEAEDMERVINGE
ncbi:putative Xaa-Pro aminopeptidase [Wilcoxina mikolae CBS 423.85]|nr:putative Xaa-Pro aminopeptidase [Wilcoxina mikolae CBS 423.85]